MKQSLGPAAVPFNDDGFNLGGVSVGAGDVVDGDMMMMLTMIMD